MTPDNWHLVVCGINHKTSSLSQRERLQISRDENAGANAAFGDLEGVMESTIVSTCNRVEFYFVGKKHYDPFELVKSFFQSFKGLDISDIHECFYVRKNKHAAAHLFSVTAGIDSMVVGENQILGQVKDAYSSACAVRTAGKVIHRLFHQAFRIGKHVRSDTEMGKGACSISSAAVDLLRTKIKKLEKPSILFIGVNQMISLAASGVSKIEHEKFAFANRTLEKAIEFSAKYDASGYSLDQLPELLKASDVVISCTGSKEPVITRPMIDGFINANTGKKLTLLDMAGPRDIEVDKDYHADVEIFDLEDIKRHVKEHQQKRELAIPQAQKIIDTKLSEFLYWFNHVQHEPAYNGLGDAFEAIRHKEMAPILKKLSPELKNEVEKASRSLVQKLLQVKAKNPEEASGR